MLGLLTTPQPALNLPASVNAATAKTIPIVSTALKYSILHEIQFSDEINHKDPLQPCLIQIHIKLYLDFGRTRFDP